MKKAVLILAALCVVSSFAFAEISIGAWGRGFFVPAISNGTDIMTINQATWWSSPPRIGFTISGKSDNVGVQLDFNADSIFQPGATGDRRLTDGDNQKIWVKLFNMLTIQIGKFFDDTLRGNAVFGAWNWIRFQGMNGEDTVFARVGLDNSSAGGGYATANLELSLAPVEGLYIFAALRGNQDLLGYTPLNAGVYQKLADVLAYGQYGAGYTIAGIGTIRLQYMGIVNDVASSSSASVIQAAFKLTAVPGLTVDIGGTIPMVSGAFVSTYDAIVALFASYALDALTINFEGSVQLNKSPVDMAFEIGAGVDYNVGGGIGVTADVIISECHEVSHWPERFQHSAGRHHGLQQWRCRYRF